MPKAILISIKPEWCEKILNGEKTIEIRKTMPKCGFPIDVYIYCTKAEPYLYGCFGENETGGGFGYTTSYCPTEDENTLDRTENLNGKVVAKFTLNKAEKISCCAVPYKKANNLGYEGFIDNGVYQLENDDGLVFERDNIGIETMLKNDDFEKMQLKPRDIYNYLGGYGKFYSWHIDNLEIFDKPKELSEFKQVKYEPIPHTWIKGMKVTKKEIPVWKPITKAPQSWCYVEVE